MRKKIFMVLLTAVMAVSASACGDAAQKGGKADTQADGKGTDGAKTESTAEADKIDYQAQECVKLGDYLGMEISLPNDYKVTKTQIEDYANSMAQYSAQPSYKDTNKKEVEEGDIVNIDYEGKKDGTAFEGGTDTGYHLKIGSNTFIDGFEDGLIGKKVGQTVELDLTFPESYPSEDLAGQAVVFTVKINKIVKEDADAEFKLTDEYVKKNFNVATVEDYRKQVKDYLEELNKNNKTTDTRQAVVAKLQEVCEVNLPDELLGARTSDYVVQFTNNNCTDGTTLADFLSKNYNGMTEEDFRADITNEMRTNLTTELILEAIAQKEEIELDEEAFKEYVKQQMEVYAYEKEEDFYKANGVDAAAGEAYERKIYVCNKALDKVVESAKITYGVSEEDAQE